MPKNSSTGNSRSSRRRLLVAGIVIVAVATAVRIGGALNDLWLDEIWSLAAAKQVSSPMAVFTSLHHEINHHLNTLYLWLVGDHGNWPGYRIPSLIAGIGTVVLAGLIGRRRCATSAVIAMLLVGFSYVLVLYSSEARGYAMAVFFSFLSYYSLDCYREHRRWQAAVVCSAGSILGLASHLTFAGVLFALLAWSVYRLARSRSGWRKLLADVSACHAAPVLFLAILYWVDIRHVVSGGGSSSPLTRSYFTALAWTLGTAPASAWRIPACLAAVAILCAGVYQLWRKRSDTAVFFVGAILVFPLLLVATRGSDEIYTRHFIIGMAFLLILSSFLLASLYDRGGGGRAACLLMLSLYCFANCRHLISLLKHGRGHYREAIRFMAAHSKESEVTIAGDHDFRISMVLEFYAEEAMRPKTARYCPQNTWPPGGTEWMICHRESFEDPLPPGKGFVAQRGNRYELVRTFPSSPLSGLHWFIYHNQAK